MGNRHRPVLVSEVVELLRAKEVVIDATVGSGGHAGALLEAGVERVVGIDRDPQGLAEAVHDLGRFGPRFRPVLGRFSLLSDIAAEARVGAVDGVLFDLGVSSLQLDRADRGFSFRSPGPLDMRMGTDERGPTAADVVNTYDQDRLTEVISGWGEERFARRIAGAIVRARSRQPLSSTQELAAVVAGAVPRRRGGPHPARRTFQALRMEVNRELEELTAGLPQAAGLLAPSGRLVAISYHSLEDRAVKRFIRGEPALRELNKKPTRPGEQERAENPRARSARLRAAERMGEVP